MYYIIVIATNRMYRNPSPLSPDHIAALVIDHLNPILARHFHSEQFEEQTKGRTDDATGAHTTHLENK